MHGFSQLTTTSAATQNVSIATDVSTSTGSTVANFTSPPAQHTTERSSQTNSTATYVSSPGTSATTPVVNVLESEIDNRDCQINRGVSLGVVVGVGFGCVILTALVMAAILILYRRRRQRKDTADGEAIRISYIQPYSISLGYENSATVSGGGNSLSSGEGQQHGYAKREHEYRPNSGVSNPYTDIADLNLTLMHFSDKRKRDTGNHEFVTVDNFSKVQDINKEERSTDTRGNSRIRGDNTYSRPNNGMEELSHRFPENVPETYSISSTGGLGVGGREESGHVYNRLRGGEPMPGEDVLKMYNVASTEFRKWLREGGDVRCHIYNRLYGRAGMTDDNIRERDLETYNGAAARFEPDTENQHGKGESIAPTNDSDTPSSSRGVKENGGDWVDMVHVDGNGQGQIPSVVTGSGLDNVDGRNNDYFILEDVKQRDIRDLGAINDDFENSTEKQSTVYFMLEDDTEAGGTREISDQSVGDHTQTGSVVLDEEANNFIEDVESPSLSVNRERNLYVIIECEQEET